MAMNRAIGGRVLGVGRRLACVETRFRRPTTTAIALGTFFILFPVGGTPSAWGSGWTPQNSGTTGVLSDVQFPEDATTGYVVGVGGTILKTIDGGANWVLQTSNTVSTLHSVHFPANATTGYVVGGSGTILKTTDGGTNWNVQASGTTESLYAVHFQSDAITGYAVGTNGTIRKTVNGTDWTPQTSGVTEGLRSVQFPVNATTGFAVGDCGTIVRTTNGTDWTSQTPNTRTLYGLHFPVDATTGYAVGSSGEALKTTDGGIIWTPLSTGVSHLLFDVHFPVDATTGYIAAYAGLVLKTIDGGTTWTPEVTPTDENLQAVHFPVDMSVGYVAGASGTICKTTDGGNGGESQIILHPIGNTSDNSFTTAVNCTTGHWDCVNDQPSNAATGAPGTKDSRILEDPNGATNREMYILADGTTPAGSIVTAIEVRAWVGKGPGPAKKVSMSYQRKDLDAIPLDSPQITVTSSATCGQLVSWVWSGLNWTGVDIDALEVGIKHVDGGEIKLCQLYVVLSYDTTGWQIASGSYTGNATDNRRITDLGFQPDVVLVKGNQSLPTVLRTSTMAGDATKRLDDAPGLQLAADLVQSLDPDGFTLGSDGMVNASGIEFYWVALEEGPGELEVGTYVGDGTDRSITVGFQPEYVAVMSEGDNVAIQRFAPMVGNPSTTFAGQAPSANRITALETNGFQVGTDAAVNLSAVTFHYIAVKSVAGEIKVGSYPGDDSDGRNITEVGFQPEWVIAKSDWTRGAVHRPASLGAVDATLYFRAGMNIADSIQALLPTGFQVGTDATVNQGGTTYYWMAFADGAGGGGPPKIVQWREVDPN